MGTRIAELAALVGGTYQGHGDLEILAAAPLYEAQAGQITFLGTARQSQELSDSPASAFLIPEDFQTDDPRPTIRVAEVQEAFLKICLHLHPPRTRRKIGISPAASIHPEAKIGAHAEIHPHVVIAEDVELGENCTLYPGVYLMAGCRIGSGVTIYANCVLYEDTVVGDRTILHAGVVLGANGFGYSQKDGQHVLNPQLGTVRVGSDCEIGANSTVDRGTYGTTIIGDGTKIDNLTQIGHNCRLGKHNLLCAQVGLAGSCSTGDYVVMAGQVGVRDHVHVGTGTAVGAMSGVMRDVPDGSRIVGAPAKPEREAMTETILVSRLPELVKRLKQLEQQVQALDSQASNNSKVA